jgi:hypothetical protein
MAAQVGTATGLGIGLGDASGEGVGDGLSAGLGDALATVEGEGLLWVATFELPQPVRASKAATAASRSPTANSNVEGRADVTAGIGLTASTIKPTGFRPQ